MQLEQSYSSYSLPFKASKIEEIRHADIVVVDGVEFSKVWLHFEPLVPSKIDPHILSAVRFFREHGFDTFTSCQGSQLDRKRHAFEYPIIRARFTPGHYAIIDGAYGGHVYPEVPQAVNAVVVETEFYRLQWLIKDHGRVVNVEAMVYSESSWKPLSEVATADSYKGFFELTGLGLIDW